MKFMDVLDLWWADKSTVIIPADQPARILEWIKTQTPDTWHQVAGHWNYDYGTEVLDWIIAQERCDRGTAAQIFLVEGPADWLWKAFEDPGVIDDQSHVCAVILRNWPRYQSGEMKHRAKIMPQMQDLIAQHGASGRFAETPLREIAGYQGTRDAQSMYDSEDGKIVMAMDHWAKLKGITIEK